MNNFDLRKKYNKVYQEGSESYYTFKSFPESLTIIQMLHSWNNLDVLEIGCGEGRLAASLGFAGAAVEAVDYSTEAIRIAQNQFNLANVKYHCADYRDMKGVYDVVVLQGVLEHLDKPFEELALILRTFIGKHGIIITSSPSFISPRGYVWMTLNLLFNIPMSLSDLHSLCPFDFEEFAKQQKCSIEMKATDLDWGGGERLLKDFKKRLPNALRDAGMDPSGVDRLLAWLSKALPYQAYNDYAGANMVYKIERLP